MTYLVILVILAVLFASCFALPKGREIGMAAVAGVFVLATLALAIIFVDAGTVRFTKLFGEMTSDTYAEGPHLINPFAEAVEGNVRRKSLDFTGERVAQGLSKNQVQLAVDVTVPYILNPSTAWRVYQRYGENWNLITPSSRNAIRDCVAREDWQYTVSEKGRIALADCIPERQTQLVIADLLFAGFTQEEAQAAFTFPTAQVRKVEPINQRILAAIAEEQAAIVDLRRQTTLTSIAQEEANRRAKEGIGIKRMMKELPTKYTIGEMVAIINANATKANAEAFLKAVEKGNPNITVITGGSDVPVTVPATTSVPIPAPVTDEG